MFPRKVVAFLEIPGIRPSRIDQASIRPCKVEIDPELKIFNSLVIYELYTYLKYRN